MTEDPDDLLEQVSRVVLGLAGLAVSGLWRLLDNRPDTAGPAPARPPGLLRLMPCSALALGLAAQRRTVQLVREADSRLRPVLASAAEPLVSWGPSVASRRFLERWGERGIADQRRNRSMAEEFVRALVRETAAGVLAEVDLDDVADRIDLDRAASRINLDLAADRIDLDRAAERIDVERIAARLDVDAVVARADLDAVITRLDLADLIRRVLDEIDFPQIVRESSGAMAVETMDAFRAQSVSADRFVGRVADRLMNRSAARDTACLSPGPGQR